MAKSLKRIHQVKVTLNQLELDSLDKEVKCMSSDRSTVMRHLLNEHCSTSTNQKVQSSDESLKELKLIRNYLERLTLLQEKNI